ncbi:MAG: di-heme oxidoredictase family protein [Candidatus Solibacter sp.]
MKPEVRGKIRTAAWLLITASVGFGADVPRTWNAADVKALEVPLANPKYSPIHISESAYYALPARTIYRSYPVYYPKREPAGYQEWLAQQDPQVAFDPAAIKTQEDWVTAGELVFNAPISFQPVFFSASDVRDPEFYERGKMPYGKDGTVPFARWVIRRKGQVELGTMGCNTCHTRVFADGTIVPGAQGNNPGDRQGAMMLRKAVNAASSAQLLARMVSFSKQFEVPWVPGDPNRATRDMTLDQFLMAGENIPAGVTARAFTSMVLPPQIPDLIGVKERRFLDHTGIVQQRSAGDLMRYAALVQDTMALARYGDDDAEKPTRGAARYTDEQLFALTQYLYSLTPPANPHKADALSARGKAVFERAGCAACHTAPLYTNNKLIPVDSFDAPADHDRRFDILRVKLGTDPRYALATRKGTGYYKVPSLKGVWYRSPLGHHGSVATLEDWLDPKRVTKDYVPTGYTGPDGKDRGVKGHEFGLDLGAEDRKALIAFLRTL